MDLGVTSIALISGFLLFFFWLVLRKPFSAFILMLPFMVVTRTVPLPQIGERFTLFDAMILMWWLGVLIRTVRGNRDLVLPRTMLWAGLAYVGFILASILSLVWAPSLVDGLIALSVYSFVSSMALAGAGILYTQERNETVAKGLVWVCLGVVLISLWEAVATGHGLPGLLPIRHPDRLTGPFRNPNQLGTFLIIAGGFVWSAAILWPPKRRWWPTGVLAFGGIVLLLTSSRTNIFAGLVQLVLLLVLVGSSWRRRQSTGRDFTRAVGIMVLVSAVAVVGVATSPTWASAKWRGFSRKVMPFVERISDPEAILRFLSGDEPIVKDPWGEWSATADETFLHDNWTVPLQAFLDSPVVGVGLGNFRRIYEIAGRLGLEVHSQYLSVLAETGILGSISVLLLLAAVFLASLKLLKVNGYADWISVGLALSLWTLMISGVYVRFLRRREFWILAGMLFSYLSISAARGGEGEGGAGEEPETAGTLLEGRA